MAVLAVGCFALLVGCERTESVQWGERGTSMAHIDKPGRLLSAADDHGVPPPEPRDPPDPDIPLAKDVNENVQVLTDLDALEFARLMQAISTWVSPEQGCEYCHNTENLASDEKYTKVVSRSMLKMTRDINANWKSHVVGTGVTCWTCHRGKPVPSGTWFADPGPKTPSAGITGVKAGQNTAGVRANANAALPFDPMTPFLEGDKPVSIQGTTALRSDTGQSVKQAEWTYALMMYISNSLGVNCTYCHQTRAMGVWEQSTPQRTTAWYGIRMVRELNGAFLNPLKNLYPADRLGPTGDAPKVGCATCHKGAFKPLLGVSMLGDYPELAGVKPPRALPVADAEPGADESADAGPEGVVDASAAAALGADVAAPVQPAIASTPVEPLLGEAVEAVAEPPVAASLAEPATEPATELAPVQAEAVATADLAIPTPDWSGKFVEVDAAISDLRDGLATAAAERQAVREEVALLAAAVSTPAAGPPLVGQALLSQSDTVAPSDGVTPSPESATDVDLTPADVEQIQAEADQAADDIQQLEADADALRGRLSEQSTESMSDEDAAALQALERRIAAADARLAQERTALLQQLVVVRAQRDAAQVDAEADAENAFAARLAEREEALRAVEGRVAAAEARLSQERHALQQQLRVVRTQRDGAKSETDRAVAALAAQHQTELNAVAQRVAAAEARLNQERHALQQQLRVVRAQRDTAANEAQAAVADMSLERSALSARLAESDRELEGLRAQLQAASADYDRELQASKATIDRVNTLHEVVAEVDGRVTDNGVLVSLGGEELRFPSGSAILPRRELPTLERVVALLAERPQIRAQIGGHTDSSGSAQINRALSEQRAEAVKRALVERGIDESRLSTAGYGADQPVADNATERGRRENRRVDILMIDGDAGPGAGVGLD